MARVLLRTLRSLSAWGRFEVLLSHASLTSFLRAVWPLTVSCLLKTGPVSSIHIHKPSVYSAWFTSGSSIVPSRVQGVRLALGPFRHPKPGMVPLLGALFFFVGMGPFGRFGRIEISTQKTDFDLHSCFEPPHFRGKTTSKCEHSKNQMKHPVDRPKMHVV